MRAVIIVLAAMLTHGAIAHELASVSSMSMEAAGTLSTLGTFSSETSSVRTRLQLTHDRALAAKVRKLLDASIAACGEDAAGRCTKDSVTAHSLLYRAQTALHIAH